MKCINHSGIEAVFGNLCGLCKLAEENKHKRMTEEERVKFEKEWGNRQDETMEV